MKHTEREQVAYAIWSQVVVEPEEFKSLSQHDKDLWEFYGLEQWEVVDFRRCEECDEIEYLVAFPGILDENIEYAPHEWFKAYMLDDAYNCEEFDFTCDEE